MVLPEALKNELNDDLFFGCEVILLYPWFLEVLASITIRSKCPFLGLLERSCSWSTEKLEIDGFEMMERLFIKMGHLPIGVDPEGQPTCGQTTTSGVNEGEEEKECIKRRRHVEILIDDLEASHHGLTIRMQLRRSSWVRCKIVVWRWVNKTQIPNLKMRTLYIHIQLGPPPWIT